MIGQGSHLLDDRPNFQKDRTSFSNGLGYRGRTALQRAGLRRLLAGWRRAGRSRRRAPSEKGAANEVGSRRRDIVKADFVTPQDALSYIPRIVEGRRRDIGWAFCYWWFLYSW